MDDGWDLGAADPARARELALLEQIVATPEALEPRRVLADLLDEGGDAVRANVLRDVSTALEGRAPPSLGEHLEALPEAHVGWARLVGGPLTRRIVDEGALPQLPRWLSVARPAIDVRWAPADEEIAQVPGWSRFFGDPDLPPELPWPTYRECSRYFGTDIEGLDDVKCRFVAQFSAQDLRGSPAAVGLPATGLLSVFALVEFEQVGVSEACIFWFPDRAALARRPHPEDVPEGNERLAPHQVGFSHALDLPANDGPWEAWYGDHDPPHGVIERMGLFGYLHPTSGSIELPDRGWQRLCHLPMDVDEVTWHHVAVPSVDLTSGRLEAWSVPWVDMDG